MKSFVCLAGILGLLALPAFVRGAEPDAGELLKTLKSGDEAARVKAIDTLGHEAGAAPGVLDALAEQLKDKSPVIRAHAAHALGLIGPAAKPAVKDMAPLVTDPDETVRRETIRAWVKIRPGPEASAPLLSKVLKESSPAVRTSALHMVAEIGKPIVPRLIEGLKNDETVYWACLVLEDIGPDAAEAVPELAEVVKKNERVEVRREAIMALGAIGPAAAPAVQALISALEDKEDALRISAAFAIARIGPAAKAAASALARCVDCQDPFLRTVAAWARTKVLPNDKAAHARAVVLLLEALKSDQERLRSMALRGLADLHPAAGVALPALKEALQHADKQQAAVAIQTLAGYGEAAVPELIEALKLKDYRPLVAVILGRVGAAAKPAVPALIDVAKTDSNAEARQEAFMALGKIGPAAAAAVPAAHAALSDKSEKVQLAACYVLGKVGGAEAKAAVPELQKMMDDPDPVVAMVAAWAAVMIQPDSKELAAKAVPHLITALGEAEPRFRSGAAHAFARLGPLAKQAVPALKQAANDPDEHVRKVVAEALKAIGE